MALHLIELLQWTLQFVLQIIIFILRVCTRRLLHLVVFTVILRCLKFSLRWLDCLVAERFHHILRQLLILYKSARIIILKHLDLQFFDWRSYVILISHHCVVIFQVNLVLILDVFLIIFWNCFLAFILLQCCEYNCLPLLFWACLGHNGLTVLCYHFFRLIFKDNFLLVVKFYLYGFWITI